MPSELHITSAIVQTRPESVAAVHQQLLTLPGVEVHAVAPAGKIIITMETEDGRRAMDLIDAIRALPGTIDTALVYHGVDDSAPDTKETQP
jgi:periplasmic nitrate reductase NapD